MPWRPSLSGLLSRWLTPRRREVEPIFLDRRRIYILPTRGGLLYALALLTMLVGAINYNLSLGHALVFLLASLGVVAMVHTFRNLLGIVVESLPAAPVFAGEAAHFPLLLRQGGQPHPRRALTLAVPGTATVICELADDEGATFALSLPAMRRGWLQLPTITLASVFPLGLFRIWSLLRPERRCLVYPRPLPSPLPEMSTAGNDDSLHGHAGDEDFAGLRERQPADPLRHIAWKSAARDDGQRPLLVKQFAGGSRPRLRLAWDLLPPMLDKETKLSLLTGWVLAADAAGLAYGLELPGLKLPFAGGPAQCQRCLETLALVP